MVKEGYVEKKKSGKEKHINGFVVTSGQFKKSKEGEFDKNSIYTGNIEAYKEMVEPSLLLPKHLGNSYTASLYTGLHSLVEKEGADLAGKRLLMFSYGSGLAATMFSLVAGTDAKAKQMLQAISHKSELSKRLQQRNVSTPEEFTAALLLREGMHVAPYVPKGTSKVAPGAFRLQQVSNDVRRSYARA